MTDYHTSMDENRVVLIGHNDPSKILFKGRYRPHGMQIAGPIPCYKNDLSIGYFMNDQRTSMAENRVVLMGHNDPSKIDDLRGITGFLM